MPRSDAVPERSWLCNYYMADDAGRPSVRCNGACSSFFVRRRGAVSSTPAVFGRCVLHDGALTEGLLEIYVVARTRDEALVHLEMAS